MINLDRKFHGIEFRHIADVLVAFNVGHDDARREAISSQLLSSTIPQGSSLSGHWRLTAWEFQKRVKAQPGAIEPCLEPLVPQPWNVSGDMFLMVKKTGLYGAVVLDYQPTPEALAMAGAAQKPSPISALLDVNGAAGTNACDEFDLNTTMVRRIDHTGDKELLPGKSHMPRGTFNLSRPDIIAGGDVELHGTFINTNSMSVESGGILARVRFAYQSALREAFRL